MNKKIIFLSTLLFVFTENVAMDQVGDLKEDGEQVWSLVFSGKSADLKLICDFATTSKANNRCILQTAEQRKACIFDEDKRIKNNIGILWNKYGTACHCAYQDPEEKQLILCSAELVDGKVICKENCFDAFRSPLLHKPAPFFNKNGTLCFYGFGDVSHRMGNFRSTSCNMVVAYKGDGTRSQCYIEYYQEYMGGKNLLESARLDFFFFECVPLLKAILNSNSVEKDQGANFGDPDLVFSLEGVTLPDNYTETTVIPGRKTQWGYKHLPTRMQNVLKKRYEDQLKETRLSQH